MILKKDKEYIVRYKGCPDEKYRIVIQKVNKDPQGNIISFIVKDINHFERVYETNMDEILTYTVPLTNTEFFTMYFSWKNFHREGVHQDLDFAKEAHKNICKTLKERGVVRVGSGKFETYDQKLLDDFIKARSY